MKQSIISLKYPFDESLRLNVFKLLDASYEFPGWDKKYQDFVEMTILKERWEEIKQVLEKETGHTLPQLLKGSHKTIPRKPETILLATLLKGFDYTESYGYPLLRKMNLLGNINNY